MDRAIPYDDHGMMGGHWPAARRIGATFLVVSGLCFAGIQLFAPSPAAQLSGPATVAPGVIADVSFTGAPTGLALGISAAVGLLVLLLWRLALVVGSPGSALRRARTLPRAQAGQAITEFVLIIWALLMVFFGVAQMALMYNAKNVALYAAYASARSAIVWIPQETDDDEVNAVTLDWGNEKYGMIKSSAAIACTPISRRASHVLGSLPVIGGAVTSIVTAITNMLSVIPLATDILDYADRYAYAYALTNVWFVDMGNNGQATKKGGLGDTIQYNDHDDVTVQVDHCLHLPIPIAAQLIDAMHNMPNDFFFMEYVPGDYTVVSATCTLTLESAT